MNRATARLLLPLAAACLGGAACEKPGPAVPVAGIFAAQGEATVTWGPKRRPTARRARPGMLLMSDMTLDSEKGVVLEAFDGTFVWLPGGEHAASKLKLPLGAAEGASLQVLAVGAQAVRKSVPPPAVAGRYEPPSGKPVDLSESAEFRSDLAFFFTPRSEGSEDAEAPARSPPASPWQMKDKYVHALRRPLKAGDGARLLSAASGAVVVEFQDNATALASTLKLPIDLLDVRRVVVAKGSATLALPGGKQVELRDGEVAEIAPLN